MGSENLQTFPKSDVPSCGRGGVVFKTFGKFLNFTVFKSYITHIGKVCIGSRLRLGLINIKDLSS